MATTRRFLNFPFLRFRSVLTGALLATACTTALAHPHAINVVCIGGIETQGSGEVMTASGDTVSVQSYRYPLWRLFIDDALGAQFVGTQEGPAAQPVEYADYEEWAFPNIHEAYGSLPLGDVAERVKQGCKEWQAAIALVMVAPLDLAGEAAVEQTVAATRQIIAALREGSPDVAIILGGPWQTTPHHQALTTKLAGLIEELDDYLTPLRLARHDEGWVSAPGRDDSHTHDGRIPNAAGEARIAENFWDAMQEFIVE